MPKLKMTMEVNVDARSHEEAKREVSDAVDTLRSDTEDGRALIASFKAALLRLVVADLREKSDARKRCETRAKLTIVSVRDE